MVIIQQLEAIGEKISDATLVAKLINDLPAKFDTFRETYYIQAATDRTITFDDIRQQLALIESRQMRSAIRLTAVMRWLQKRKSQATKGSRTPTKRHERKVNVLNVISLVIFEETVGSTKPESQKSNHKANRSKQIKRIASH